MQAVLTREITTDLLTVQVGKAIQVLILNDADDSLQQVFDAMTF